MFQLIQRGQIYERKNGYWRKEMEANSAGGIA